MNDYELSVALLRGHALHARIAADSKELKRLADSIRDHALDRPTEHVPLEDEASEGTRWIYERRGMSVVVVCPKDKLKASIRPDSKGGQQILAAAGDAAGFLFDRQEILVPKDGFRLRLGQANLTAAQREKILRAASSDSSPQVRWEILPEGGAS